MKTPQKEKMVNAEVRHGAKDAERSKCCYAIFTGQGGYPMENDRANATFEVGKQYIITGGSIRQSSTSLEIEGYGGGWNSVMFDFDWEGAPLVFPYLTSRYNAQPIHPESKH